MIAKKTAAKTYETAPGVVFAYRLHMIRTRRVGVEGALFIHKSAFLSGAAGEVEDPVIAVQATLAEIDLDLEEEVHYRSVALRDGECFIVPPLRI